MSVPVLRFKDELGRDFPEWDFKDGGDIFDSVTNKNHNSDLPILAITQEHGAIPRNLIEYQISVTDKSIESYKVVEIGDFIISLRSFQGGIEYSKYKGICSPAYIVLRPKQRIVDDFYKFYFKTSVYIRNLNSKLEGIRDGKMVSYKYFSEIQLPYPCEQEQTKIASFLMAVDKKITQLTQKCELLAQYKKGVMQQIFSQELRFKDDDGQDFPEWKTHPLSYWLSESKARNYKLHFNKTDVLSVSGEFGVVNQIEFMGRSYAGASVHNYHILESGNIVYTKSPLRNNPYGIIKFNKGKSGIVSTLYAVYKCYSNINGEILDYYFQLDTNLNNYLKPLVRKGAKNDMKVNNGHVLTGQICLPSCTAEQNRIVDFLNKLDEKIKFVQAQLEAAKQYKQGLLQKMFI